MTQTDTAETPQTLGTIHATELRHLLAEDPDTRIIDVRTGSEFASLHIHGSFNVPLDTLAEHARDLATVEHPVVLVCQSGQRATTARTKLEAEGKTNLRVLEGGVGAWQSIGGEVARGVESWSLERQVRGVAGGIVLTSIVASALAPRVRFLAGAVGAGLTFSAISNTCAMGTVLSKLPYNRGPQCNVDEVVAALQQRPAAA